MYATPEVIGIGRGRCSKQSIAVKYTYTYMYTYLCPPILLLTASVPFRPKVEAVLFCAVEVS